MVNPLASTCEVCGKWTTTYIHKRKIACPKCIKKLDEKPTHVAKRDAEYRASLRISMGLLA